MDRAIATAIRLGAISMRSPRRRATASLTTICDAARREMYEELAIMGTLLATGRETARRGHANPQAVEALHRKARANLQRLLGANADRAVITGHGLEVD